jgi:dynamin 1-like protein
LRLPTTGDDNGGTTTLTCRAELLIQSYFHIVRRTMIDMVPKAIMLNLVQYVSLSTSRHTAGYIHADRRTHARRSTKIGMQKELLENMYRSDTFDELLKESDYTVRRRKECQQMVESLSRASEIVGQVQ